MKKIYGGCFVLMLVLSLALSAHAVTISDTSGETYLYQIFADPLFSGGNYASSQIIANTLPILSTLPAGPYAVTAFAKFAAFTQNAAIYAAANPALIQSLDSGIFPYSGANGIFAIAIGRNIPLTFGFADIVPDDGAGTKYTQLALNPGGPSQSNGLIFQISPTHFIVAFEDGNGSQPLGDIDYNDLVLNVEAVPLPPSALLLGSGLLGLLGFRLRRK